MTKMRIIRFEIVDADSRGRIAVEAHHPEDPEKSIGHVVISPLDVDPDHYWWVNSPEEYDPNEIINSAWEDYGEERMLPEYWDLFKQSGAKTAWKVNSSYVDKNFRTIGLGKRLYEIMKAYVREHEQGVLFPDNATDSFGNSTSFEAKRVWKSLGYDQPLVALDALLEPMSVPHIRGGWERNKPKLQRKKRTRQSNAYLDESTLSRFVMGHANGQGNSDSIKATRQQIRKIIREELSRLILEMPVSSKPGYFSQSIKSRRPALWSLANDIDSLFQDRGITADVKLFDSGYQGITIEFTDEDGSKNKWLIVDQPGVVGLEDQSEGYIFFGPHGPVRQSTAWVWERHDRGSRTFGDVDVSHDKRRRVYSMILDVIDTMI